MDTTMSPPESGALEPDEQIEPVDPDAEAEEWPEEAYRRAADQLIRPSAASGHHADRKGRDRDVRCRGHRSDEWTLRGVRFQRHPARCWTRPRNPRGVSSPDPPAGSPGASTRITPDHAHAADRASSRAPRRSYTSPDLWLAPPGRGGRKPLPGGRG